MLNAPAHPRRRTSCGPWDQSNRSVFGLSEWSGWQTSLILDISKGTQLGDLETPARSEFITLGDVETGLCETGLCDKSLGCLVI